MSRGWGRGANLYPRVPEVPAGGDWGWWAEGHPAGYREGPDLAGTGDPRGSEASRFGSRPRRWTLPRFTVGDLRPGTMQPLLPLLCRGVELGPCCQAHLECDLGHIWFLVSRDAIGVPQGLCSLEHPQ